MRLFTDIDENILRYLGHYKYLTIENMVNLKIGERSYICTRLKKLRKDGFVAVSEYGGVYKKGHGRAKNLNYLLPKGAKMLCENIKGLNIEHVHYPKNIDGVFRNDYFHKMSTVNTHLSCETWIQKNDFALLFFHTYYHKLGSAKTTKDDNPLRSITRVNFPNGTFIEPDVMFAYDTPNKRRLMALEVSNGKDTSRIVEQLKKLVNAVGLGLITNLYSKEYNIQTSPRILCTVETESMLELVIKRINNDPYFSVEWIQRILFLNVAEAVWQDFDAWFDLLGNKNQLCTL